MDKPCCSVHVFKTDKGYTVELVTDKADGCCSVSCCEPKK